MLFQPTNVTPSMLGEIGNGVVDVNNGIPVSWQVNGNSPLTKFQIDIYTNDEYSIPLYSTGEKTNNCPFYPMDANGNPQIISYTIPWTAIQPTLTRVAYVALTTTFTVTNIDADDFMVYTSGLGAKITYDNGAWVKADGTAFDIAAAGITISGTPDEGDMIVARDAAIYNGENLKLKITQWWSASESTVQTSESAFITRATPVFGIVQNFPSVTTKDFTFSATYSQDEGDVLNWIQWQLAYADDVNNPVYDTGKIYGATDMTFTFDGFLDGYNYSIRCLAQTQNGVDMVDGWEAFPVVITAPTISGVATAKCQKGVAGVLVSWESAAVIPGTATGNYFIDDSDSLMLETGSVIWNTLDGNPFDFAAPWAVAWRGQIRWRNVTIFEIGQSDGDNIRLSYFASSQTLALTKGGTTLYSVPNISSDARLSVLLTDDKFYVYCFNNSGGLYPGTTLYPSGTLYPQDNSTPSLVLNGLGVTYTQAAVTSVTLRAAQYCQYIQVFDGIPSQDTIDAIIAGMYIGSFDDATYMLADFDNGLNAGNLPIGDFSATGYSIYREENGLLKLVAKAASETKAIIDYGARSQGGQYRYFVYLTNGIYYAAMPLITDYVSPCWWDWVLVECIGTDNLYTAIAEYHFGKNLTSGTISNNNAPSILPTFTRYPNVQISPANYASGTLQSLIGVIDAYGNYSDTVSARNAIFALATTPNTLFLKSRKGDLWKVRIAGAITAQTSDNSPTQAQAISIPWVECGNAENCGIAREA